MSLKALLGLSAAVLGLLVAVASAALLGTSSLLRQSTETLAETVAGIRAAEELEIQLLLHDRESALARMVGANEHVRARDAAEAGIRAQLRAIHQQAGSEQEADVVERMTGATERYLELSQAASAGVVGTPHAERVNAALGIALEVAESLSALNLSEAGQSEQAAARVETVATAVGIAVSLALVLGISVILLSLRYSVYDPLLRLREALMRFGQGMRGKRMRVQGPKELRDISTEFNEMTDALERQSQAQLQFLAGVAHDIKNPLATLRLAASSLLRAPSLNEDPKAAQTLHRLSRQVERLNRMVEDLLDTTRIEAGHFDLRREERDFRELVSEVVELHRPVSEKHDIELRAPSSPVPTLCDGARVEQVLNNLLSNAIKYSPQGGTIRVTVETVDSDVEVAVSDPGMGISSSDVDRIFEPFRRTAASREGIPGVGLGLSVARRIVEAHGGTIFVESELGHGSTFRVRLPARLRQAPGEGRSVAPEADPALH